jgi:nicotinamide mononucleotide transporter
MLKEISDFLVSVLGTNSIEITATLLGIINVALIIRRSIWNYPFGIAMVILYAWIFFDYKLYAEAGLQVYFLMIQFVGWYWWMHGRGQDGKINVLRVSLGEAGLCAATGASLIAVLGFTLNRYTDASLPYLDSAVTSLSIIAQFLLARQRLESWLVWIATDILAIGIYLYKGMHPTAFLYVVFLFMAVAGFRSWSRNAASTRAVSP